ncbi:MAG TPA: SMP-30/gluconolactonase/LRE family protein [Phycisphaerae bacterium]|nr:SMP-30/gluconolactonase/LRE family protein [Phycisphaerales bacterium]HRX84989.1 SMP-30/gluconolactonase/LRE family protein [Phycisphaerae bacterium]
MNLRGAVRAVFIGSWVGLMGAGCASAPKAAQEYLFFPSPPEQPRIQFLTWASGADQIEPQRGAFEEFVLGDQPAAQRSINKPYGVAVHDGVAYVCDTKGLCLNRLDFKNGKYDVIGVRGPGRLRKPINIVIDPLGYKFVADSVRNQIVVYGPDDQYIRAFDVPAPCHVVDVAVYGEELFALDNDETCQIVVLNRTTGDVIRTLGGPGGEPGQFKIPNSLCVSPDGYLYVSDTHNWRIQKLTRDGEPVWTKGTPGYRLGQFGRPRGIRVSPDNIIYVVDGATEIVQLFDPDGNTLMRFGGPGDVPGALGLPSTLAVDASSIPYFQKYVHKDFKVKYLLFVVSQYGQRLVNVYAFGAFPDGYHFSESDIAALPHLPIEAGIGPVEGADQAQDPAQIREQRADDE